MGHRSVAFLASCGALAAAIVLLERVSAFGQAGDQPAAQSAEAESKSPEGSNEGASPRERAVAAALNWLARHQSRNGSWGLLEFSKQCKGPGCSGPGTFSSDAAGTALGLLPFLAAGQTYQTKGPYRKNIYDGLYWLMRNQKANGDLSVDKRTSMYAHGMATIVLCEAYGATRSKMLGKSAQNAISFIEAAQHPTTGGWRYTPGEEGDTSVLGWQLTALRSGELAGLKVKPETFAGGQFAYRPDVASSPSMTAVGTFCSLLLGGKRGNPAIAEGVRILAENPPSLDSRNAYYVYYATHVMSRMDGPARAEWHRQLSKLLCDSQVKDGCATGSWAPDKPTKDSWGEPGGRLYTTSLSALALESHYRYLLIYRHEPPKRGETGGKQ
jgi:hypothetical protein